MAMKNKKMNKSSSDMACESYYCHPHGRGKALYNLAIGLFLIMFGFGIFIQNIEMLALGLGVLFVLKGGIKMMGC
jgi:divalent metal cation (Fe/Co/Zn/Cd) transporter